MTEVEIEGLQSAIARALPAAELTLRAPRGFGTTWWLTATLNGNEVSVVWSLRHGFEIYDTEAFGQDREACGRRVVELLQESHACECGKSATHKLQTDDLTVHVCCACFAQVHDGVTCSCGAAA